MNQIDQIRAALLNDTLTYSAAYECIKKMPQPWSRPEWKAKRSALLKGHCEQCGTTNGSMVIQHLRHPKPFYVLKGQVGAAHFDKHLKDQGNEEEVLMKEFEKFIADNRGIRKGCPACRKINIMERKKLTPRYRCNACTYGFDVPIPVTYLERIREKFDTPQEVEWVKRRYKDFTRDVLYQQYIRTHDLQIGKEALLLAMELSTRYMEMVDAVTYCKKCSFLMDMNGQVLCTVCSVHYHTPLYP